MEFPQVKIKSQNEAIRKPGGIKTVNPLDIFIQRVANEYDSAIASVLEKKIGPEWDKSKVELVRMSLEPTVAGMTTILMYDRVPIGKIRNIVAVQENKAVGNLYIEITEVEDEKRV